MKILAALVFIFIPSISFAIDFTPLTITSISDNVDIDFPSSYPYGGMVYTPDTIDGQAYSVYPVRVYQGTGGIDSMTWENFINDSAADQFEGTYRIVYGNLQGVCETLTYDDCLAYPATDGQFLVLYDDPLVEPPTPPTPPTQNETWGSSNGFWGSTTPSVIISDMQASVQDTGGNIWPLFAFVGIPVAFLIGAYLIYLINKELTPVKDTKKTKKEDFIPHSADDLEFKREYGTEIPKRKRGRPRKTQT